MIREFTTLKPKTYTYLIDDDNKIKKQMAQKKRMVKLKLKFEDKKHCLEAYQLRS